MTSKPNPEIIALARESRGITQTALAKSLVVPQWKISRYESGLMDIPNRDLKAICATLNYPESLFYFTDQVFGYGSSCLYHRKRQSLSATHLKKIIARINVFRINIGKFLHGIEIEPSYEFPRLDITDEHGTPADIARFVRGMWNLPSGPIHNLIAAIEAAGGIVVKVPFETDKLDAISQWLPGFPPLFFINSEISTDRCRYTLAHEIAHIVMHHIPTPNLEREADEFASEFLMPKKDIAAHLKPLSLQRLPQLKMYWKVSMAALIRRANDLRKITNVQYKSLMTQISRLGYRKKEPVELVPEETKTITLILNLHLQSHKFTRQELSKIAGAAEDDIYTVFLANHSHLRVVT